MIPEKAVQAVIEGIDHESIEQTGLDHSAIHAVLRIAAPILAEEIAARLRAEANQGSFTAPARQQLTYVGGLRRAARLARGVFPGAVAP